MFVVDTNVLVYAAERSFPEHIRCRERVEEWRRSETPWYLTWSIVYELARITTHPRIFARPWAAPQAWGFIGALLAAPSLRMLLATERHAAVVDAVTQQFGGLSGNLFHDLHIAALMREHGIRRIVTRDSDFHRFPFLDPVDPLD
ncbi:MAG: PIN domain-containing protein [Candidatus Riflebacteria bacterium]|nr:PIN domain-containing protein [Candidatus Riflebacteria bacterium]